MKITGISIVRDEADILRLSLLHHLAIGCDDILVIDNGSTDDTPHILRKLSRRYPVRWTREEGPFRQAERTTELAREAARAGADWVVPFDTDEFWWAQGGSLRAVLAASSAGALRARVANFVQHRKQLRPSSAAVARMTWRAEPVRLPTPARELVEAGEIAFVEINYPPKHVARAGAGIEISKGNHQVAGIPGPIEQTEALVCLHAPLRSRVALENKAATAPRQRYDDPDPSSSWHTKRWGRLAEEGRLDEEWAANSQIRGVLGLPDIERKLVFDTTLRDVVISRMFLPRRLRWRLASLWERGH